MPWRWRRLRRRPAVSTSTNVAVAALEHGVDRVARRAGNLGDDHALAAEQRVERGSTCRRSGGRGSRRGSRPPALGAARRCVRLELADDLVEQVAGAVPVQAGDRDRVAEAEPVQLERERVLARVVDLVREHEHRLVRLAQDLRDLLVAGRDPELRVDDEEDEVGLGDRLARLVGDRARDRRLVGDVDAARVDEQEALAGPLADELLAVARDARRLVDDGRARAGEAVDERRLADVRKADDRDGAEEAGFGRRTEASPGATAERTAGMFNGANTAFMLVAASLVMLMTPGLAFFYGGLVGRSNTLTIMIQSFASMGITTVMWWLVGYSLCFSGGNDGIFGNFHYAFLQHVSPLSMYTPSGIPLTVLIAYQMMFAIITPRSSRARSRTASRSRRTSSSSSCGSCSSTTRSSTCGRGDARPLGRARLSPAGSWSTASAGFAALASVLYVGGAASSTRRTTSRSSRSAPASGSAGTASTRAAS